MSEVHPVTEVPDVKEAVNLLKSEAFPELPKPWPRGQDLGSSNFKTALRDDLVLAVSHAWPYGAHPDPLNDKSGQIEELVEKAKSVHKPRGSTLLFCDFLSVSQRPFRTDQKDRTKEEEEAFAKALRAFPQIYLQADAVLHLDTPCQQLPGDARPYTANLDDLSAVKLACINGNIHVVAVVDHANSNLLEPFDMIVSVNGEPVHSLEELEEAKNRARQQAHAKKSASSSIFGSLTMCACDTSVQSTKVEMRRLPFGIYSALTADQKGWVFLERFASMVKGAMAHEDQEANVAFATSERLEQELRAGSQLLRQGARGGQETLREALQYFVRELENKQFSAVSVDKATNTGGAGGGGGGPAMSGPHDAPEEGFRTARQTQAASMSQDRRIVEQLMVELTDYLAQNWEDTQKAQRQRQLLMSVLRGDVTSVKQLLLVGVDPNLQDQTGMTCVHLAAKCRELEVAKTLLEHQGRLDIRDSELNVPAHRVALYADETTVELFRALAPSQDLLEARNNAGVTPIQRFAVWATSAAASQPYLPAAKLVAEFQRKFPSLHLLGDMDAEHLQGLVKSEVKESTVEVQANGKTVRAVLFEPADGKAEQDVVGIAMEVYMSWGAAIEGWRRVAQLLCRARRARLYVLSETCLNFQEMSKPTYENMDRQVVNAIKALPVKGKFMFVMNSLHGGIGALWDLKDRVSCAVCINVLGWLTDDFLASPAYQGMVKVVSGHQQAYANRDFEKIAANTGNYFYAPTTESMKEAVSTHRNWLGSAADEFWSSCLAYDGASISAFLKAQPPLPDVPVLLLCGSLSPALLVQETAARLNDLIRNSSVAYIPDSKQWWPMEGEAQAANVAFFLGEVLRRSGAPFDMRAAAAEIRKRMAPGSTGAERP